MGFSFFFFFSLHLVSEGFICVSWDSAGLTDFLELGIALDRAIASFTSRYFKPFVSVPVSLLDPFPLLPWGSVSSVTY